MEKRFLAPAFKKIKKNRGKTLKKFYACDIIYNSANIKDENCGNNIEVDFLKGDYRRMLWVITADIMPLKIMKKGA